MKNDGTKAKKKGKEKSEHFPKLLTRRETEIVHWCAAGKSNAEQAIILDISPHTVNFHLKNIYQKLDVQTRAAAVNVATSMGLIFNDQSGKKKIVQDVYKSFVVGDLTPFRKFLDEKTEWISTAPQDLFPHAGRYKGIESILTQIETVSSLYLTRSFLPRVFVEEAEQLAVYLDVSLLHRESGNEMFFDVAHFWTFRSGKIARYVEIFNSAIAQNQQDRSALPKTGSSSES